ncbi:DMT family transporter [Gulosibacter chungangensis]|uniref:DMT family transporter n=1 Tax=Gulosibacter chungangensis TaxID=979746 RepID=A0A7J5B9L3_9MICO|nr:DMT family transporter [Gulosibacter chungangensis]KAB1642255.1 DMT family transporter [Gulosibacter chungangensis]
MTTPKPWLRNLVLVLTVLMGVGSATQSRINGSLSAAIGSGPHAAAISFGVGLLLLIVITLFRKDARQGVRRIATAVRGRELPWWGLLGGACGASFVLAQGVAVPFLGVAVLMTSMVVGQLLGSLAVDHFGLMGAPKKRITWMRGIGATLAILAVVLIGIDAGMDLEMVGLMLFSACSGFLLALQLGITGTVRSHAQDSISPSLLNFIVGFIILAAASLLSSALGWVDFTGFPTEWWLYLGGIIGVVYLFLIASVVRTIGVFVLSLALVGGQLLGSLIFDLASGHASWMLGVAAALAFVGITVAHLGSRAK